MTALEALLFGVLEGLTEFLPVSSTGHLILLGQGLGHEDDATKTLEIVIQLGAVLAVVVYYRKLLLELLLGVLRREPARLRLVAALGVAFVPAAGLGYLFHRTIKEQLMGARPVAGALIVGGLVMIGSELALRRRTLPPVTTLEHVTLPKALLIGIAQCASLWPGTSRSMTTIVGGQVAGLRTETAAEFSFLLSIPLLGAATVYDLHKNGGALLAAPDGGAALGVGLLSAFVVSIVVISAFLRYLKRFGLLPFGVYRIGLGILVLALVK